LGVSCAALQKTFGPDWKSDPRCYVVYDGIEPARFAAAADRSGVRCEFGLADDGPLFIHVGRMTEEKNHRRLISIFREVLQRRPQAQLLLVGRIAVSRNEIAIEKSLRRRIEQLGLAGRVTFSGERTDVPRLMKAADVLIFPSSSEGLGDVVLEASAAGTPALCSNLPSIREIADRLPGVRCLPLGESDATWGEIAAIMADDPPSEQSRSAALKTFSNSVFTAQRCIETLCRIWRGEKREEGREKRDEETSSLFSPPSSLFSHPTSSPEPQSRGVRLVQNTAAQATGGLAHG
jgi:glycosyltransferase involved in cell wall biosynthesis